MRAARPGRRVHTAWQERRSCLVGVACGHPAAGSSCSAARAPRSAGAACGKPSVASRSAGRSAQRQVLWLARGYAWRVTPLPRGNRGPSADSTDIAPCTLRCSECMPLQTIPSRIGVPVSAAVCGGWRRHTPLVRLEVRTAPFGGSQGFIFARPELGKFLSDNFYSTVMLRLKACSSRKLSSCKRGTPLAASSGVPGLLQSNTVLDT